MGPIMLDVLGTSLTPEDCELLQHPLVGGAILFARNYHSPEQISALTTEMRKAANKPLIIGVDHEGGRVQRFREGFTSIPAMGDIWSLAKEDSTNAKKLAYACGALVALEVKSVGVDISFAPSLDVNGISAVIGDRAFHQTPEIVTLLSTAFIQGMHAGGMKATAKHFPGHGSVQADSHIAAPIDTRPKQDIFDLDLRPFVNLIQAQLVDGVMPAHVIFPDVDDKPVGFSEKWLQDILRKQLGFTGAIFSDDLSMEGAGVAGGYIERAEAAQSAGCDMLLLCNNREGCIEVIDRANITIKNKHSNPVSRLMSKNDVYYNELHENTLWQQSTTLLKSVI